MSETTDPLDNNLHKESQFVSWRWAVVTLIGIVVVVLVLLSLMGPAIGNIFSNGMGGAL